MIASADGPVDALNACAITRMPMSMKAELDRAVSSEKTAAPLAPAAIESLTAAASQTSAVELDPQTGERGHRDSHVSSLLAALTGAEAGMVVNNNAAALLLAGPVELFLLEGERDQVRENVREVEVVLREAHRRGTQVGAHDEPSRARRLHDVVVDARGGLQVVDVAQLFPGDRDALAHEDGDAL